MLELIALANRTTPQEHHRADLTATREWESGAKNSYSNPSTVQFRGLCPLMKAAFHDHLVKSRVEQKNNYRLGQYKLRGKTETTGVSYWRRQRRDSVTVFWQINSCCNV